ncbi:hypothetical protein L6164_026620 [Bauhinia variegata]|uniref:Uncharacterized protein n=1 Tax=Bauhinia variegata TaxID=167791 RepID=A0ACB9LQS1_BAUVA|nr:hypothetical protein L6164_026620 [Bauhinia variegata]
MLMLPNGEAEIGKLTPHKMDSSKITNKNNPSETERKFQTQIRIAKISEKGYGIYKQEKNQKQPPEKVKNFKLLIEEMQPSLFQSLMLKFITKKFDFLQQR